eukprot:CAMPEP_0197628746 /NCGR_PEP_ID=MMETSP1338-20131121/6916_1 /TAXON_ID=43686 ORGANISM="Pelagodinium beii, Strain RCC1491" /NCGR_SAMPLE_ID=MMETSP1338 /ASSEMBLY_ACC=CAM_ASM_000754 /LENGTH=44 /DNA_ID= /DNA_START= /DNA_END= /DNA_ORIENTATION=
MATLFPPAAADSGFHPTKLWPHHSAGVSPSTSSSPIHPLAQGNN